MRSLARVVWHEGMHLAQHHFQAQSRYFEELGSFAISSLFFAPYGVVASAFDEEALRNGSIALVNATGILPDGLPFQLAGESLPEPREVRSLFSPTQEGHVVLLGIPTFREGQANCALEGAFANGARYRAVTESIRDENVGIDAKPVSFARTNARLLLDMEDATGLVTLPLARVRRDGAGNFAYDAEFIPPALRIGASPRLVSLLHELTDMLAARADSLSTDPADAANDITSFWLANALHASLGPLLHLARTPGAHPSVLFLEMSRLAAALCTFSMNAHPRDLPLYDHDRPDECFAALYGQIKRLLGIAAPTTCVRVPLRPGAEGLFNGTVSDPRALASTQWFMGVRSSLAPIELASAVPRLMKVCSAKHIERLVREAFPGLPLTHVASPPPQISPRAGTQYFAVPNSGPCWSSIVETHEVGIYAPASIADVEIELVIALES